ncbi:MAG: HAD-IIB family hydrolase [Clostridia bacterium]|nr:HAD-IIB family hydrolase [Clostridia bacterium]
MKLIVSDLDGTLLLKKEGKLHRLSVLAIERIMNSGAIFCVASGRNYSELKRILKDFDDKIYFIANDGALTVHKEKTIFSYPIEFAKLQLFDKEKSFVAHGKYHSFVKSRSERFIRQIKEQYLGHIVRIETADEIDEPIYKITLYEGKKDFQNLNKVYCDNLMSEYVEIGVNKGKALAELLKILKIKESDTVVAGDGSNDAEMFEMINESYVMASATPRTKKMGKYVVNSINDVVDNIICGVEK